MEQRFIAVFVFVFLFLGTFVSLVGIIPSGFLISTKTYSNQTYSSSESWSALYLQQNNDTKNFVLNRTWSEDHAFDFGGRNLRLYWQNYGQITLRHMYGFLLWWFEDMDWYNENQINQGSMLTDALLNTDYEEFGRLQYTAKCLGLGGGPGVGYSSAFHISAAFSFNDTTYDTPQEAWEANDLRLALGIGIDQMNTGLNAWNIIGGLLTFQKVEVFGTSDDAQTMNRIVSYGFWAAIVAMAFIVIIQLLQAINIL